MPAEKKPTRQAKVTPETIDESRRLKEIWERTEHPTQDAFGEAYGIGNQSAVAHFLNGRTPLSIKAAKGFAKGLRCSVEEFSPRLFAQMLGMAAQVRDSTNLALALATEFDRLPEEFADGGTKRQFLIELLGEIQGRPERVAKAPAQPAESKPSQPVVPKRQRDKAPKH